MSAAVGGASPPLEPEEPDTVDPSPHDGGQRLVRDCGRVRLATELEEGLQQLVVGKDPAPPGQIRGEIERMGDADHRIAWNDQSSIVGIGEGPVLSAKRRVGEGRPGEAAHHLPAQRMGDQDRQQLVEREAAAVDHRPLQPPDLIRSDGPSVLLELLEPCFRRGCQLGIVLGTGLGAVLTVGAIGLAHHLPEQLVEPTTNWRRP